MFLHNHAFSQSNALCLLVRVKIPMEVLIILLIVPYFIIWFISTNMVNILLEVIRNIFLQNI